MVERHVANVGVAGSSPVSCSIFREPLRGVARRGFLVPIDATRLVPRGVPSGAAKVEEAEVRLLLAERVRVHAQGQLGVRVTELRGHPAHALARGQREARVGVARIVESERAYALLLRLPTNPMPRAGHVALIEGAAGLGEDQLRNVRPSPLEAELCVAAFATALPLHPVCLRLACA